MTGGGPAATTQTIGYYIYLNAFKSFRMGYASALATVLFLIIMTITLVQWRLQNKWVFYG
jgi:multiple sugar transport system permease protein